MTPVSPSTFVPPSPGAWELEQTHLTRPTSVFLSGIFPEAMMRGFAEGTRAYGLLLDHLEVAVINRFVYMAPRPVGAPKGAKGPPPRFLFKLLCRLHPELRRRIRRADEAFRTRYWREEMLWWDREVKPALTAEGRALLAQDLATCSTADLVAHLRQATEFLRRAICTHHRFNVCAMIPLGDFLVHAMEWTGLSASELLKTMRGLSPVSAGAVDELRALRQAVLGDGEALRILLADRPADDILRALQHRPAPVGAAAQLYLDLVGLRVIGGYDVADRHAREHPDLLVKVVRAAVTGDETAQRAAAEQELAGLRERVPPEHRAAFDDLLREAQLTYRIRDERVFHADALAIGVARRAILAAGGRLTASGRIGHPEHLVDATPDEIVALLEGTGGPTAVELAERARFRLETPLSAAPSRLGTPPSPPPPADWLPPAAARAQRITGLVLGLMFDPRKPETQTSQLKGFPVSSGVYEGPARVIRSVDELPSVQPGEVLVTPSTGPTFNVVLPLIGALVTERGGVLSHAAIVSREYGLPGVVGCLGATQALRTGMRVRVDGDKGEVWALQ